MKLVKAEPADSKWLKALYEEAFPSSERVPFRTLKRRSDKGLADFYKLVDNGRSVGLAYLISDGSIAYLFYFAIDKNMRGRNYGSLSLAAILEKYQGKRVFLALEDWEEGCNNKTQRLRRHAFYLRCGLQDLPHRLREVNLTYRLMGVGGDVQPEEYKHMIDCYLGWPWKHLLTMKILP